MTAQVTVAGLSPRTTSRRRKSDVCKDILLLNCMCARDFLMTDARKGLLSHGCAQGLDLFWRMRATIFWGPDARKGRRIALADARNLDDGCVQPLWPPSHNLNGLSLGNTRPCGALPTLLGGHHYTQLLLGATFLGSWGHLTWIVGTC